MSWLGVQPLKKFNAPFCTFNCDSSICAFVNVSR
ncbi:hypothetical protein BFJ72_g1966 [Fusarium proliferatum]|uniref:Uncharacterized protein n=1 Tax=Gibberella intermedia TaxID=948311 RepID=A0A420U1U3_GIBIN|nr:hypothetical protein BFJ72_g1966 [Fusarium proliferatum]